MTATSLADLAVGGMPPKLPQHLWRGIVGAPGVTNWAGPGKVGKGLAWATYAAIVSRGWPNPPLAPDDPRVDLEDVPTPGNVIVVSPEDSAADVYHRVNEAGGDMTRIFNLSEVEITQGGTTARSMFSLPRDIAYLAQKITEIGDVRVVILDNLMALATTSVSFNQQYRMNLGNPLEELGRNYGVRIILVNHFTKGLPKNFGGFESNRSLGDYIFGSAGVIQAHRLTVVFMPDPDNPAITTITTYQSNGMRALRPPRYVIEGEGEDVHLLWEPLPITASDEVGMVQLVHQVLHALAGAAQPVSEQQLATWLHVPHPQIQQALEIASNQGLVHQHRHAWFVRVLETGTGHDSGWQPEKQQEAA